MIFLLFLSSLIVSVFGAFQSGLTHPAFDPAVSGQGTVQVPATTYDNCKFFKFPDGTDIKLYWNLANDGVEIVLELEYNVINANPTDSGYIAIGVSPTSDNNPMKDADIIISYLDALQGFAYVAEGESPKAFGPPSFKDPWKVPDAVAGATASNDQYLVKFKRPASWLGSQNLIFSHKKNSFDTTLVPVAGADFPTGAKGAKHVGSKGHFTVRNFDFSTPSTTCDFVVLSTTTAGPTVPPTTPTTVTTPPGACEQFPTGTMTIDNPDKPLQKFPGGITLDWTHDCANKQTTFKLSMTSTGWIGMGFVTPANWAMTSPGLRMQLSDTYQFSASESLHGYAAELDTPTANGGFVGTPVVTSESGVMTAEFTRDWQAPNAETAPLDKGPLFMIFGMHKDKPGLGVQHSDRMVVTTSKDFFADPSATPPPTTPQPTTQATTRDPNAPTTTAADLGDDPCADATATVSNAVDLPQSIKMEYVIDCAAKDIEITLTGAGTQGWLSVGFSKSTDMKDTDTYQCRVDKDGNVKVRNGFAPGYTVIDDSADIFVGEPSGSRTDGNMKCTFKRKLEASDAQDFSLSFAEPFHIIVARNVNEDAEMESQHSEVGASSADPVQLFTSEAPMIVDAGLPTRELLLVHGALMIVAWAVLAPIGSFFARYLKAIGHQWFLIHQGMLGTVSLFTIIGLVLAMVQLEGSVPATPHVIIGFIIVGLAIAQPILGVLADKLFDPDRSSTPIFPDIIHQWLGRLLVFLGFVNCLFGLMNYAAFPSRADGSFPISAIVYIIWSLLMLAVTVAGQFVLGTGHDGDKDKQMTCRNINFGLLVAGVLIAALSIVMAVLFLNP